MNDSRIEFERVLIHQGQPADRVLCVVGDIDGDGRDEIVIGSRRPENGLHWLGRGEDGRWHRHLIDNTYPSLEAGGVLFDIDGDGRLDFIAGGDWKSNHLSWWQCPTDPTQPWQRHLIFEMPQNQSHDQFIADIDGDGRPELYFWNQKSATLFSARIPDDPTVSPWPDVTPVSEAGAAREEGFAAADIDGDGTLELVAGLSWYKYAAGGWQRYEYAHDFVSPRVAAADFDGDGRIEIIMAEGDASFARPGPGRLVYFTPPDDVRQPWQTQIMRNDLTDPHSVVVADFDGDGRPDVFVGELGDPNGDDPHPPAQRIYWNRAGQFVEQVIDEGLGTHESKAVRIDGRLGLVAKPYRNLDAPRSSEVDAIWLWLPVE